MGRELFDALDITLIIWAIYNKILDTFLTIYGVSIGMEEYGSLMVYLLRFFHVSTAALIDLIIYIGLLLAVYIGAVCLYYRLTDEKSVKYKYLLRKIVSLTLLLYSFFPVAHNILQLLHSIKRCEYALSD